MTTLSTVTTAVLTGPSVVTVPAPAPAITAAVASQPGSGPAAQSPGLSSKPLSDGATLFAAQGQPSPDSAANDTLTPEEQEQIDKLKDRDREVRAHEQAHVRAGGQYAGAPSYDYQTGPDGRQYAVGGEVPIDVSPVPDDAEATIDKMQVVKKAALAPAEPSSQDRAVAAKAESQRLEALAELNAGEDTVETNPLTDESRLDAGEKSGDAAGTGRDGDLTAQTGEALADADTRAQKAQTANTIQVQIEAENQRRLTGGAAGGTGALQAFANRVYAGAIGGEI